MVLRAPLDRVWRAISDSQEFGRWFGVRVDGPFVAGTSVTATITGTTVDDKVAEMQRPHVGATGKLADRRGGTAAPIRLSLASVRGRTRRRLRTRNPSTLVEFTLSEAPDGVLLRIVESGFDAIPEARRAIAFEANSEGWAMQTELVRKYLSSEQRV